MLSMLPLKDSMQISHLKKGLIVITLPESFLKAQDEVRGMRLTSARRESTCLGGKIHPTAAPAAAAAAARCLICPQLSRQASQCTILLLSPRKLGSHMTL
ncbi:hypothetical protein AMECASPLE_030072 [Ameca splendens]|uniref:Uncharacterized protein n=1 Tax=Ameca splendens TaxID=208324 RepID=A0ABV1A1Q6_9TELE